MIDDAQGVLAIWNDIRDGRTDEFESWYKHEHFPERLAVPGFRLSRATLPDAPVSSVEGVPA